MKHPLSTLAFTLSAFASISYVHAQTPPPPPLPGLQTFECHFDLEKDKGEHCDCAARFIIPLNRDLRPDDKTPDSDVQYEVRCGDDVLFRGLEAASGFASGPNGDPGETLIAGTVGTNPILPIYPVVYITRDLFIGAFSSADADLRLERDAPTIHGRCELAGH